jgi:putative PEP-CTERM system histidine kinase
VVAVGVYLIVMSLAGLYLRQVGGSWGAVANILFFVGALVVLAVVVMSGTVRRRLRVFVSKHFFRNKYDYRVEWLRFVETLSGAGGAGDVRRTSLAAIARIFESPGGVLFAPAEAGRDFEPVAAWPMRVEDLPALAPVPAGHEFLRFLGGRQWVIDLQEYAESPETYQNLEVPAPLRHLRRARVIAPLLQTGGLAGFVLLLDPPPPFELTFEDRDLLKTVGRHVATILAQHEADRRLAEGRQFDAYHRLTAFMMHDLKNAVAQLQLVVRNAEKHRHNPEFIDDALETIANAVERMNRLIEQLSDSGRPPPAAAVDLGALVARVVERCSDREPCPDLGPPPVAGLRVLADPERLGAALEHVVRNAQDATAPDGEVSVTMSQEDGLARIAVKDTGAGMSAEFLRERLFRPFDSTKGAKGMGIGAYQVREYVRGLGGSVEVQSSPGAGTRFEIILPVLKAEAMEGVH